MAEESLTEQLGGEREREALDAYRASKFAQEDARAALTIERMTKIHEEVAARTDTPAQERVAEAQEHIDAQREADEAGGKKRAYGTAGRTNPAELSEGRYRRLPKWRNADDDYAVAQYFRAQYFAALAPGELHADGGRLLKQIMGEDAALRKKRAVLDIGATGGTDGVFQGEIGEALPLPVANYVQEVFYDESDFLSLTRQFQNMESVRIPLQTDEGSSASVAEKGTIAESAGSVKDHVNLRVQKQASKAELSTEVLEARGTAFSIVQWVVSDLTAELAEKIEALLYATGLGAGSNQPNAFELNDVIITATTSNTNIFPIGAAQIANHFLAVDIDDDSLRALQMAVPKKDRSRGVWAGNDQVALAVSNIKDSNGRQMYASALDPSTLVGDAASSGAIGTIQGKPFFNLPGAEEVLGSVSDSNENRLYYFNPNRSYATLTMGGARIAISEHERFSDDIVVYKITQRIDGDTIGNNVAGRESFRFIGGIDGAGTPA